MDDQSRAPRDQQQLPPKPTSDHSRRSFLKSSAVLAGALGAAAVGPNLGRAFAGSGNDLIYMPAGQQLDLFKAKELSPVEVLKAQIAQAEAVEEKINAFTYTHYDEAMTAARDSEDRYMRGAPRPLEGITVAIKDEYDKVGWTTTAGSKVLKDNVATRNHPAVDKLLEAGAVIHAQTTVPEMYFAAVTWTDLWGVTRNPWNLHYTVGGSSGGSGAALAAGTTTVATGSDMGGSTRIPCAFNGLYGYKPPYGRNAPAPGSTFLLPATEGPMARTFADMVRLQNVMVGPAPYTPTSLRPAVELPFAYDGVKGMKIAYDMDQSWAQIDPDVVRNTEAALKLLEGQGAIIEEVDLKLGMSSSEIRAALVKSLLSGAFGADMADLLEVEDELTSYGRYFARAAAQEMGPRQAKEASDAIHALYARLQDVVYLKGYKAFVMPTLATNRIAADYDPTTDSVAINGVEVDPHVGWVLTAFWNLLNWNPVVAVPTGLGSNQVPTGMQIATPTYDDLTAMQVSAAYAEAAPPLFTDGRFPDFRDRV